MNPSLSRLVRAILPLFSLLACRTEIPAGEPVRAELLLDPAWELSWERGQPSAAADTLYQATFQLPGALAAQTAVLELDRVWWSAQVRLNGQRFPAVAGNYGVARIDVSSALQAGTNNLSVLVSVPAADVPAVVTGGLKGRHSQIPAVIEGPSRLIFTKHAHVRAAALPMVDDRVRPLAWVSDAPEGATVRFVAALDGEALADLGTAPVVDGIARGEPVAWKLDRWGFGSYGTDALLLAVAELRDAAGEVLDRGAWRTGVREAGMVGEDFKLNGRKLMMFTLRADDVETPSLAVLNARDVGLDALEIHGHRPSQPWLDEADELGVPVVVLPRCHGMMAYGSTQGAMGNDIRTWHDHLLTEQRTMLEAMADQPSLLMWLVAGVLDEASLQGELFADEPLHRTLGGVDMPHHGVGPEVGPMASGTLQGPNWIVETAWPTRNGGDESILAANFVGEILAGTSGGVINSPSIDLRNEGWYRAWGEAARRLDVPALDRERRGPSLVRVTGLEPGQTAWIHAPWLTPSGVVADANGAAELIVWHQGPAVLSAGGKQIPLELTATHWRDFRREGEPLVVDLAAVP